MFLEINNLSKAFIGLKAVDQVSISITEGTIVGLIGPNGSGKSTLFNCISGYHKPTEGIVYWKDENITGMPPEKIALKGITRTFQMIHVFKELTVMDNLLMALQQHQGEKIIASFLNLGNIRKLEQKSREKALELLEFGGLAMLKEEKAGNISYGQQKILSFLTTLMSSPSLVLLDEPTAAINPTLIGTFAEQVKMLNRNGLTFFIVEHNMDFIMELCERIIVLDYGMLIADGKPKDIKADPKVVEAYFGH